MKRIALYIFSVLVITLFFYSINPTHAAEWSYAGKLSDLMAGAPVNNGDYPYPPTAIVDFQESNFNYWLIIKDDKYWYYGKDRVWKDLTSWQGYGLLSSCWSSTGYPVDGYEPVDNISATFLLRGENKFFVIRKGENANGPMYWIFDRNTSQWVDSGYLKDYWGTPNAGTFYSDDPDYEPYIYSDGGPTAITYIEEHGIYLIIKNNIYWLLRKKNATTWEWFESGTLAELSQYAPEASNCGDSLPRNISTVWYSDYGGGDIVLSLTTDMCDGLAWVVDISDTSSSTGYPDLFSGYTFTELTGTPSKVQWNTNLDTPSWAMHYTGCNYIYDSDMYVLQALMRQVHYESQMVDPTVYQIGSDSQMIVNDLSSLSGYCTGTCYSDCADSTSSTRIHSGNHAANTAADLSYFSLTDSNCTEGYCCPDYPDKFIFIQDYYFTDSTYTTVDASKLDWLRCALFWSRIIYAYKPFEADVKIDPYILSFVNNRVKYSPLIGTLKETLPVLEDFNNSELSIVNNHRTHQHLYLGGKNTFGQNTVDWDYMQNSDEGWFYLVTEYPVQ